MFVTVSVDFIVSAFHDDVYRKKYSDPVLVKVKYNAMFKKKSVMLQVSVAFRSVTFIRNSL